MYQGIYFLSIRDFKSAANNFLDSISTFTSYELMDYKTFVTYTVLASMIALERVDLRTKVVSKPTATFICRTNDTEKTGPQITLLVLMEQSYETITMKIKMNNKLNRGDLNIIFIQLC